MLSGIANDAKCRALRGRRRRFPRWRSRATSFSAPSATMRAVWAATPRRWRCCAASTWRSRSSCSSTAATRERRTIVARHRIVRHGRHVSRAQLHRADSRMCGACSAEGCAHARALRAATPACGTAANLLCGHGGYTPTCQTVVTVASAQRGVGQQNVWSQLRIVTASRSQQ